VMMHGLTNPKFITFLIGDSFTDHKAHFITVNNVK
jgi:hypothetical protein